MLTLELCTELSISLEVFKDPLGGIGRVFDEMTRGLSGDVRTKLFCSHRRHL